MSKEPIEYLKHIKDECSFILSVVPEGFSKDEFLANEMLKRAVVRSLEIIGEADKLKIIDECKKAGLPEPDIEINSGGISVTIFKKIKSEKHPEHNDLNDRQTKTVEYVKLHGRITNKEYQTINSISRETATIDLRSLVKLGILKSSGTKGAGAFYELS